MHKNNINIVHIITSLEVGGAQAVLYSLVTRLPAQEFTQCVIYFHDGPYAQKLRDVGVQLYKVEGWLKTYDPIFCVRLLRLLKKLKPDLVHTLLWSANVLGRFAGFLLHMPVVLSLHNIASHNGRVRSSIDKLSWFGFVHIVAVSDIVKKSYIQKNSKTIFQNMSVIPNGIDMQRARACTFSESVTFDIKKLIGLTGGEFIFGTVGRLVPVKRHDFLIKSFALIAGIYPHARLVLVGDGPELSRLRMLARALKLEEKIFFAGQQDSYVYYPLFNCFVLSSQPGSNDSEAASIALLEAMSFGLPSVVTSESGAHPVINSGVNGELVTGDERKLARALELLMLSDVTQKEYGRAARDMVKQKYCQKKMVHKYARLFGNIVE